VFSTESRAQGTDLRRRCGFASRGLVVAVVLVLAVAFEVPLVLAETAATEPLAEVNGETITTAELERALGAKLCRLQEQLRSQAPGARGPDRAASADSRGRQAGDLGRGTPGRGSHGQSRARDGVRDRRLYQANKGRLRGDESRLRDGIRAHLQEQKLARSAESAPGVAPLAVQVVVRLQPPLSFAWPCRSTARQRVAPPRHPSRWWSSPTSIARSASARRRL